MAALQGPRPWQGWSETRPTRAPRRALDRTHAEDSAPEPAVSSDSDVEVVGDPVVEERESGGGQPNTARDVGRRRSGTPEGPHKGCLPGHQGSSEEVPGPGAVGRGAAEDDGGGGAVAGQAASGPRSGGGAMACPSAGGGVGRATIVGGTGGGLEGGSTHHQVRGRGAQYGTEERGWGRGLRAFPSEVPPTPRYEGDRGDTSGRDGTAEGRQTLRFGHRRRTEVPGEARSHGHPGVRTIK